jgi:hypothetical protein
MIDDRHEAEPAPKHDAGGFLYGQGVIKGFGSPDHDIAYLHIVDIFFDIAGVNVLVATAREYLAQDRPFGQEADQFSIPIDHSGGGKVALLEDGKDDFDKVIFEENGEMPRGDNFTDRFGGRLILVGICCDCSHG